MLGPVLTSLDRWARASQQVARRNAMLATTEAVRRRVEREDAESFVASRLARPGTGSDTREHTAAAR